MELTRTAQGQRAAGALVLLVAVVFAAGVGVGFVLKGFLGDSKDTEIRLGRAGFTNPLLDCEVGGYRRGRELPPFAEDLQRLVSRIVDRGEATNIALYFRDLDNGPWVGIGEDTLFRPGSLLKVPLIMACMAQADTDSSFLRRAIRYEGLPDTEGVGSFVAERPLEVGRTYTVEELIEQVAVYSDNYAALLLDRAVDRGVLEHVYRDLGLDPAMVREPLRPAAISPKDFGHCFRVLYNASYLSRSASEKVLAAMSRSTYWDGLVAGVPPGMVVSHKFGVSTEAGAGTSRVQLHDCGIVYHPERPYFLCVMTIGSDEATLAAATARISKFVARSVGRRMPAPGKGRRE